MKLPVLLLTLASLILSGCIVVIESPQKKDGAKVEATKTTSAADSSPK